MLACLPKAEDRCGDIYVPNGVEAAWPAELRQTRHPCYADRCCDDVSSQWRVDVHDSRHLGE